MLSVSFCNWARPHLNSDRSNLSNLLFIGWNRLIYYDCNDLYSFGYCFQFRFATGLDRVLIVIGVICSSLHGAALPLMIIVFGDMTDSFINDGTVVNWWNDMGEELVYNATCTIFGECRDVTIEDLESVIVNIT